MPCDKLSPTSGERLATSTSLLLSSWSFESFFFPNFNNIVPGPSLIYIYFERNTTWTHVLPCNYYLDHLNLHVVCCDCSCSGEKLVHALQMILLVVTLASCLATDVSSISAFLQWIVCLQIFHCDSLLISQNSTHAGNILQYFTKT